MPFSNLFCVFVAVTNCFSFSVHNEKGNRSACEVWKYAQSQRQEDNQNVGTTFV